MAKKKVEAPTGKTLTGQEAEKVDTAPTDASIRESVVVTFGRFNPPTKGHANLVEKMKVIAEKLEVDHIHLYASHTQDQKKNPLDYDTKIELCTEAFGDIVQRSDAKNIFEVLEELDGKYSKVYIVLGEDRAQTIHERISPYNGDLFMFEHLEVIGIARNEYSATKARDAVINEDFDTFAETVLTDDAATLFEKIHHLYFYNKDYVRIPWRTPEGKVVWKKYRRKTHTESTLGEMTSDRIKSYLDKALHDRGEAERKGDEKRVGKRTKGAFRALDIITDRINKGKE